MCLKQSNELLILEMVMWQDWPFLDYSSTIWNPHHMGIIHELENVQRRATKADILTYHNLFWKTIEPQFTQFILSSQSCAPDYDLQNFKDVLVDNYYSSHTRSNGFKVYSKTSIRWFTFSHWIINDWNSLPRNVVTSSNVRTFRSNLSLVFFSYMIY